VSQRQGQSTFAVDAVYEPIVTHTWGDAPTAIQTAFGGTIPAGGKTTENNFVFSNVVMRLGVGQDARLDGMQYPLHLQGGIAAPTGPLTLTPVSVTTHQLSVSVPLP